MARAATMDSPAPDNDASVKSLEIFLQTEETGKPISISKKITSHAFTNPLLYILSPYI